MSHGHKHSDYKRVFGDVERASRGLIVLCDGNAPKSGTDVYQQSRAVCLGRPLPGCGTCEHSKFSIKLRPNAGNELVACPRWKSESERLQRVLPQYEMVRREQCLLTRPYEYCAMCPHKEIHNAPRISAGWWEEEKWNER